MCFFYYLVIYLFCICYLLFGTCRVSGQRSILLDPKIRQRRTLDGDPDDDQNTPVSHTLQCATETHSRKRSMGLTLELFRVCVSLWHCCGRRNNNIQTQHDAVLVCVWAHIGIKLSTISQLIFKQTVRLTAILKYKYI